MISASNTIKNEIISPVRDIRAKVEFYEGSTLVETCNCNDRLISFNIERIGDESRFFGYGICQRLNVHLIDKDRELSFSTSHSIKVAYQIGENELVYPYPTFHISEVNRNENTNELSITAYDLMYPDAAHLVSDMTLPESYTLLYFISAASVALNATGVKIVNISGDSPFMLNMPEGGNFVGTETIREALNDVAEATQTIYYIDNDNKLVFKRLLKDAAADLSISKEDYISLSSKTNRRLDKIYSVTELGDNLFAQTGQTGTTQYIRENAFWTKLSSSEIAAQLDAAIAAVGGLTINQFDCSWRGNFLLEIGDKIALTTKDNSVVYSYVIDDVVKYEGYLTETTKWTYNSNDAETEAAPTTLGEALNQTFAKVDKVNKEITLVVQETNDLKSTVSSIKIDTDGITSLVESKYDELDSKIDQTASTIRSEVNDKIGQVNSSITQTATEIRSEVSNQVGQLDSKIDQTATEIKTEVNDKISGFDTRITQNANSISTIAANQEEFSEFQQTVEGFSFMNKGGTVKISGGDINLTGAIKFGDLSDSSTIQGEIDEANDNASTALSTANSISGTASSALTKANNALTTVNGITIKEGSKTYIDGETIYSNSIYADAIHLGGALTVYQTLYGNTVGGYFGYDSGFNSEGGLGFRDATEKSQVVCTDQAARLSYGSPPIAQCVASSSGNLSCAAKYNIYFTIDGTRWAALADHGTYGSFRPTNGASVLHLGAAAYKWDSVFAKTGTIQTSDRNQKNSIEDLPEKYITLFDNLQPRRFKLNDGTSGRYHIGYIAQEVEEAMATAGIDSLEFGGFVKDKDEEGNDIYMLRYNEFNTIYDAKIRQLETEIAELKASNEELKACVEQLL